MGINDYVLQGVLVDTRASRSLSSLSTIWSLGINEDGLDKTPFMCTGFDQSEKLALGIVQMEITVGPLTSTTIVIIMEEEVLEPLILGRSWLVEVGAMASPIHQLLKFKHEGAVVSIPANRLGILCKFKLTEPQSQIATLRDKGKKSSQLPPWRRSSLWGPKP